MDKDARRAGSDADDPAHLVERGILEKANVDGFSLARAQPADGIAQLRIDLAALRHIHRVRGCRPAETKTSPPGLTALMISGQVDHRLVKPGTKRVDLARRPWGEPNAHKRLLHDVLRHGVITNEQGL